MHSSITAARELRQRALDWQRIDITHQAADVLALAGQGGAAAQAVHFKDGFEQRFRQAQMLLQLAQFRRPHPGQPDAQLLQRLGLALAMRAAGALQGLIVASGARLRGRRRGRGAEGRFSLIQGGFLQAGRGAAVHCYNRKRNDGTGRSALP